MGQIFPENTIGPNGTALGAFVITPNDSTDLAHHIRAITLSVDGTLSYVAWDGTTRTTDTLPAGTYPVAAKRVRATGTTATGLTGWI